MYPDIYYEPTEQDLQDYAEHLASQETAPEIQYDDPIDPGRMGSSRLQHSRRGATRQVGRVPSGWC